MIKIIKRSKEITDDIAIELVLKVIKQWKISWDNDQYCHMTVIKWKLWDKNIDLVVFCRKTETWTIVFELSIE